MMKPEKILATLERAINGGSLDLVPGMAAHAQASAAVLAARSQQTLALVAVLQAPYPGLTMDEMQIIQDRIRANCGLLPTTDTEGSDR